MAHMYEITAGHRWDHRWALLRSPQGKSWHTCIRSPLLTDAICILHLPFQSFLDMPSAERGSDKSYIAIMGPFANYNVYLSLLLGTRKPLTPRECTAIGDG